MPSANPRTVVGILRDDRLDAETKKSWLGNYARETGYDNAQHMMESLGGGQVDPARAAFQGVTGTWGDEFLAAMRSGLGRGDLSLPGYEENLAKEQATMGMYELYNPGKAMGAELAGAGAMLVPGIAGGGARGAAATGGIMGGIAGGGSAQEGERLAGAALGVPLGVLGGLGGYGVGLAGEKGLQASGKVLGAGTRVLKKGATWLANFLGYGRTKEAERQAMEYFSETLSRHGMTIEEGIQVLQNAADAGLDMRAGDLTPEVISYLTTMPGKGQVMLAEFLEERAKKLPEQLEAKIMNALGGDENAVRIMARVRANQTANAAKDYPEAYKQVIPIDDELLALLKRPSMVGAWQRAVNHAKERGLAIPRAFKVVGEGNDARLVLADKPGEDTSYAAISMESWDWLKRGLDRVINSERDKITGRLSDEGGDVDATRRALVGALDIRNKAYAKARQRFASDEEIQEAIRRGQKFLKEDPDQLEVDIEDFTEAQRQYFRIGASKGLIDLIRRGPDTANKANKIINNRGHQLLLRQAFGNDEAYEQFSQLMQLEAKVAATRNQLYGSQTAPRLGGEKDIPIPDVKGVKEELNAEARRQIRREMSDEIAKILKANPVELRQIYANPDAALAEGIEDLATYPQLGRQGALLGGYAAGRYVEPRLPGEE
jgi:hypothetical protein